MKVINQLRKFLAQYDKYAVNGVRPGLDDEFYALDGGEHNGGASLRISDLRAIVELVECRDEFIAELQRRIADLED